LVTRIWTNQIEQKRLGLLHELVPNAGVYGTLLNPNNARVARRLQELQEAASKIGKRIFAAYAGNDTDLDAALGALSREQVGALLEENRGSESCEPKQGNGGKRHCGGNASSFS